MNLHNNKYLFNEIILQVENGESYLTYDIIKKDYYVSLFLNRLILLDDKFIFKGGTSLSKCFKLINRFSEDIDLSYIGDSFPDSIKKHIKNMIVNTCDELDFNIINIDDIKSKRKFNAYKLEYTDETATGLKPHILIETTLLSTINEYSKCECTSIIYDYLLKINREDLIKQFQLNPFFINVQDIERTFIDKIFIICDYYLENRNIEVSRHIYDLYRLKDKVKFENIKDYFNKVKEIRSLNKMCISAQDNIDIIDILNKIKSNRFYEKDYNTTLLNLIYDKLDYNEAISIIDYVIRLLS